MRPSDVVTCLEFPCAGVRHECFAVPGMELDPEAVTTIVVAEAAPDRPGDHFYAGPDASFARATVMAFRDAGLPVGSVADLLRVGVYLTTAVKCGKRGIRVGAGPVKGCARLLAQELEAFPKASALLLMGDVAVRTLNQVARAAGLPRVVPAGATYQVRGGGYRFGRLLVHPTFLHTGPAFFVDKAKRAMVAEDIRRALGP